MMPEISLTQDPAHVRHGSSIGQPLTRRDGILKVKGEARYAADNHPPGMLHAVLAVSSIARGRVTFLDVQAAKSHPGVVEVMTPANRPPLAEDPDAKTNPFMFRLDAAAERPGALCQPADRGGDRRDAGGGDGRRGAAVAALRGTARPGRARWRRKLRAARRSASAIRPRCGAATSRRASPRRRTASMRPTRRRRSTTTPWSRTRSWRHGTAIRCRSTRRARASPWRRGGSPDCSASRRRRSISAAPSSAAASAPRA